MLFVLSEFYKNNLSQETKPCGTSLLIDQLYFDSFVDQLLNRLFDNKHTQILIKNNRECEDDSSSP